MNLRLVKELIKEKAEERKKQEIIEQYEELKNTLENYQGTMQDFFNEYSGDEINQDYMTLYYGNIKVKIYNDLTLDKHFIEYDNDENPTKKEYKED